MLLRICVACSLLFAGEIVLPCELPSLPGIPASPEPGREAKRVRDDTESYLAAMAHYVGCIQAEFAAARAAGAAEGVLALIAERNNVAVAEFERVVDIFRERVGSVQSLDIERFSPQGAAATAATAATAVTVETERCISVVRLRATRIVNGQTILFVRPSGRAFLNVLRASCPALLRSDGFSYEVRGARNATLCATDLIYPNGAAGAVGCPLGVFREIAESEAEAILARDGNPDAERPRDFEPLDANPDD